MSKAGLRKMGSGRAVRGLVIQGDSFQPRLRRNEGKKLRVGGMPRGTSLHPTVTPLLFPPHHHPSVSASCISPFGVGSVSPGVGLFLGGGSVLLGARGRGLGFLLVASAYTVL